MCEDFWERDEHRAQLERRLSTLVSNTCNRVPRVFRNSWRFWITEMDKQRVFIRPNDAFTVLAPLFALN